MTRSVPLRTCGLLACALAVAVPARAQDAGLGLAGGINLSEINASGSEALNRAFTNSMQPVGGLFFVFDLGDRIAIRTDALYSVKGSRLQLGDRDTRVRLTYVELPMFLRFAAFRKGSGQLDMFAGGYGAYLIDATSQSHIPDASSVEIKDAFTSIDAGWLTGIGVGFGPARLEGRYSGGVRDLAAQPDFGGRVPVAQSGAVKFRTRGFTFLAAVSLVRKAPRVAPSKDAR